MEVGDSEEGCGFDFDERLVEVSSNIIAKTKIDFFIKTVLNF
jgi:hypothetical protein